MTVGSERAMTTTDEKESDQLRQRRANFEELQRLGVPPYPRVFARTDSIQALVDAHGGKTHDQLEAARVETRTAGRILAIRSFGKANFLAISDGARPHPGVRPQGRARRARFRDLQAARLRRLHWRRRAPVPDQDQRADDLGVRSSSFWPSASCRFPRSGMACQDVEIRYRQRYLDLIVNPESRRVFEIRSRVLAAHPRRS